MLTSGYPNTIQRAARINSAIRIARKFTIALRYFLASANFTSLPQWGHISAEWDNNIPQSSHWAKSMRSIPPCGGLTIQSMHRSGCLTYPTLSAVPNIWLVLKMLQNICVVIKTTTACVCLRAKDVPASSVGATASCICRWEVGGLLRLSIVQPCLDSQPVGQW